MQQEYKCAQENLNRKAKHTKNTNSQKVPKKIKNTNSVKYKKS